MPRNIGGYARVLIPGLAWMVAASACSLIASVDVGEIPSTTGGSGGLGGGGMGASAGSGGEGGDVAQCETADDCPGRDTTCATRKCDGGICKAEFAPLNEPCMESEGVFCNGNGSCVACITEEDCDIPQMCAAGQCLPLACDNGRQDAGESDVDCGGPCAPCAVGLNCTLGEDCVSNFCGDGGTCALCTDDGDCVTTDFCDLGGTGACVEKGDLGTACAAPNECASALCVDAFCCNVACDGLCQSCAAPAAAGTCSSYANNTDPEDECGIDVCNGAGVCRCTDGANNGQETGVDCGGPACDACLNGQPCLVPSDCLSGICTSQVCVAA